MALVAKSRLPGYRYRNVAAAPSFGKRGSAGKGKGVSGRMRLSIVVPCYNEEDCLPVLHGRVTAAARAAVGSSFELVLVNDGSRDRTWPIIRGLCTTDPNVVGVDLSRNHGQQLALTAGLSVARGDLILILDADLQDPPELLGAMIETLEREGADLVYGQRRRREGETWFKKTTSKLFYRMMNRVAELDLPVDTGDFRLMTRRALDALLAMPEENRFMRGMMTWIGFKQVAFPYDRDSRLAGQTKWPVGKLIRLTLDATTGFSITPLRLASHLGIVLGLVAMLLILFAVWSFVAGYSVPGWASLMVVVVTLGSVQMLLIGMLGEYVGRIYLQVKARPLFIVREIVARDSQPRALPLGFAGPASFVESTPAPTPIDVVRHRTAAGQER